MSIRLLIFETSKEKPFFKLTNKIKVMDITSEKLKTFLFTEEQMMYGNTGGDPNNDYDLAECPIWHSSFWGKFYIDEIPKTTLEDLVFLEGSIDELKQGKACLIKGALMYALEFTNPGISIEGTPVERDTIHIIEPYRHGRNDKWMNYDSIDRRNGSHYLYRESRLLDVGIGWLAFSNESEVLGKYEKKYKATWVELIEKLEDPSKVEAPLPFAVKGVDFWAIIDLEKWTLTPHPTKGVKWEFTYNFGVDYDGGCLSNNNKMYRLAVWNPGHVLLKSRLNIYAPIAKSIRGVTREWEDWELPFVRPVTYISPSNITDKTIVEKKVGGYNWGIAQHEGDIIVSRSVWGYDSDGQYVDHYKWVDGRLVFSGTKTIKEVSNFSI